MKEQLAKCTRWSLWLAAAAFSLGAGRAMANEGEECEGDDGHGCICTGEHHGDDEGDDGGCLGGCSLPKCACDAVFDPVSRQPAYKSCAARVRAIEPEESVPGAQVGHSNPQTTAMGSPLQ